MQACVQQEPPVAGRMENCYLLAPALGPATTGKLSFFRLKCFPISFHSGDVWGRGDKECRDDFGGAGCLLYCWGGNLGVEHPKSWVSSEWKVVLQLLCSCGCSIRQRETNPSSGKVGGIQKSSCLWHPGECSLWAWRWHSHHQHHLLHCHHHHHKQVWDCEPASQKPTITPSSRTSSPAPMAASRQCCEHQQNILGENCPHF